MHGAFEKNDPELTLDGCEIVCFRETQAAGQQQCFMWQSCVRVGLMAGLLSQPSFKADSSIHNIYV